MTDNAYFAAYKEKINEMLENGNARNVDPTALPNPYRTLYTLHNACQSAGSSVLCMIAR